MSLVAFPLERRFSRGDRVTFVTQAGNRIEGTVCQPRDDRPQEVRVWADETGFWRVPPRCLRRLPSRAPIQAQTPMQEQLMRRVAQLYRELDPDQLMAHVDEDVELGLVENPREAVEARRKGLREKLGYYFQILGRPITPEEARKVT